MERYYQPEIECASREELTALQNERLVKQVKHVWENVPYYKAKMEAAGIVNCSRSQFYIIYSLNREIFDKPLYELIKKDEGIVNNEEKYKKEVLSNFFKYGRLTQIPTQRKKREIVLAEILEQFDFDREYEEKEVNEIILRYHDDFCTIRREMIAFGMMTRDHERYKRVK